MAINKKSNCVKHLPNIIFICIIALVLLLSLINTLFFPKEINKYENRYSNKVISPSLSTILNSKFQNSLEDALSDQILYAEDAKKIYNNAISAYSKSFVQLLINEYDKNYISYKNSTNLFGGRYVAKCNTFEDIKDSFKSKADNYNALFKKYPEIDFYTYYIERDCDIDFEKNQKLNADDYLFSLLDLADDKKRSFEVENFEEYSKWFYKTDHHWNHIGSYRAYKDLVDLLGAQGDPIEKGEEVLVSEKYMGSRAETAGSNLLIEPFYAYRFEFPEFVNISSGDYGAQAEFIEGTTDDVISYGGFYGPDAGEMVFDTGLQDRENILVIGESYDNAILKLLATHYNKTYSIDLRNYEHYTDTKFDFDEYIEENKVDKVLLIGNIDFYHSNTFELE